MRTLILILILACGFGSAALWQQLRVQRLREERVLAAEIRAGSLARTPSGILGKDEAVVVIGRPAGAPPAATPPTTTPSGDAPKLPANPPPVAVPAPPPPGDFVMEVSAGQSLSKIAQAHYGHAPADLVTKLAQYNGLADANALRAGMTLKLPPLDKLGVVIK
jgi:nucleoid-associated protein YgaU